MTGKRYGEYIPDSYGYACTKSIKDYQTGERIGFFKDIIDLLNEQNEENQSLKEEKELLKNKLDRIEDILPHFLSCAEISEFQGKTFNEDLALMKFWNRR